eukprot:m.9534 g.9534  ORF g.9534 m.9534 type:complete len:983 (-) comp4880_c0_seq1:302-3250(-)
MATVYETICNQLRVDGDHPAFDHANIRVVSAELATRGFTPADVEQTLQLGLGRAADGWLQRSLGLCAQPGETLYAGVAGFSLDTRTNRLTPVLLPSTSSDHSDALFSSSDVDLILRHRLTTTSFSLDPLSHALGPQPLQEMTWGSPALAGTSVGATLLSADLLLKYLINGVEVCSKAPFSQRPLYILRRSLPEHLFPVTKCSFDYEEGSHIPAAVRSWIECICDRYTLSNEDDDGLSLGASPVQEYLVMPPSVTVRHQLFRSAPPRQSADYLTGLGLQEYNGDGSSPIERVCNNLTQNFYELAEHLHIFKRLMALSQLTGVVKIAQDKGATLCDPSGKPLPASSDAMGQGVTHKCPYVPSVVAFPRSTGSAIVGSSPDIPVAAASAAPATRLPVAERRIGHRVDAQDFTFRFFPATILEERHGRCLVHFEGFGDEYNEWLSAESSRLRPLHSVTRGASTGLACAEFVRPAVGDTVWVCTSPTGDMELAVVQALPGTDGVMVTKSSDGRSLTATGAGALVMREVTVCATMDEILQGLPSIVGKDVDVRDFSFAWYKGFVRGVICRDGQVHLLCHYLGWKSVWDEFVPASSGRVTPRGMHTRESMRFASGTVHLPDIINRTARIGDGTFTIVGATASGHLRVRNEASGQLQDVPAGAIRDPAYSATRLFASAAAIAGQACTEGEIVLLRDEFFHYHPAFIKQVLETQYKISYQLWPSQYDELVSKTSPRLRPTQQAEYQTCTQIGIPSTPAVGEQIFVRSDLTQPLRSARVTAVAGLQNVTVRCDDGSQLTIDMTLSTSYQLMREKRAVDSELSRAGLYQRGGIKMFAYPKFIAHYDMITDWFARINVKPGTTVTSKSSIATAAKTMTGLGYKRGGKGILPGEGVDCSHMVNNALRKAGYDIPYKTAAAVAADTVNFEEVSQPAADDLIFWPENGKDSAHIGVVTDVDSKTFIGAQSKGVAEAPFGAKSYWGGRPHKFLRPKKK